MQRIRLLRSTKRVVSSISKPSQSQLTFCPQTRFSALRCSPTNSSTRRSHRALSSRHFHSSRALSASGPSADALMEALTDLYSTAKDEFEIAAEETEKKTVYAADDREAAKEALGALKKAYERALKESDPEVAKEVQSRTGPRIRELENALTAVEESAMED